MASSINPRLKNLESMPFVIFCASFKTSSTHSELWLGEPPCPPFCPPRPPAFCLWLRLWLRRLPKRAKGARPRRHVACVQSRAQPHREGNRRQGAASRARGLAGIAAHELNEIKIVFNALSDHLISLYDAFFHDGSIYLALEYMDCGSLEGLLRAAKSTPAQLVPEGVSASVLFQILQGLTYLHHVQKAVHRGLKPANVLLDSAGCVKLSHFGSCSCMHAQAST